MLKANSVGTMDADTANKGISIVLCISIVKVYLCILNDERTKFLVLEGKVHLREIKAAVAMMKN